MVFFHRRILYILFPPVESLINSKLGNKLTELVQVDRGQENWAGQFLAAEQVV